MREMKLPRPHRSLLLAVGASIVALGILGLLMGRILASTDIAFLRGEAGARWVGVDEPFELRAHGEAMVTALFRKRFDVEVPPARAILTLRSMRSASVSLDGRLLLSPEQDLAKWKQERRIDLRPWLSPGSHELQVRVSNHNGPALLLAHCRALELSTGEGWMASQDGEIWRNARDADTRRLPAYFDRFPSSLDALLARWRLLLLLFLSVSGITLWSSWPTRRGPGSSSRLRWITAGRVRWGLLLAWLVLALNNFVHVPVNFGFDWQGHIEYIHFVAEHRRIPMAYEGWQMFQSPLYYVLAALPYSAATRLMNVEDPGLLLRLLLPIPLACGALQVQMSYLAARYTFPGRDDLQILGTLLGGFLPINLYASQHVSNEPLAGLLSSTALVLAITFLAPGSRGHRGRDWILLGSLLGLALLTKATAVLLFPPLLTVLTWKLWRDGYGAYVLLKRVSLLVVVAFLICGWYYLRNWVDMGSPFVRGWGSAGSVTWWQEPGYRTPADFLSFGAALPRPLFAAVHGFWDGLYSSLWTDGYYSGRIPAPGAERPWNESFLIAGSLLGLLPTLAIAIGVLRGLSPGLRTGRWQWTLAISNLLIFVASLLYLFLEVPTYSTVKATYTLGLIPCYVVLATFGFDVLTRWLPARAVVYGLLACWAPAAYLAYFVTPS